MYFRFESAEQVVSELQTCDELTLNEPNEYLAIFVAMKHKDHADALIAALNSAGIRFFGGLFPALLKGDNTHETGLIALRVPTFKPPKAIPIGDASVEWGEPLAHPCPQDGQVPTLFVVADYWSRNISGLLQDVYNWLGPSVHYLGMGAGFLQRETSPCLFTNDGLFSGCALVTFLDLRSDTHLRHGWKRVRGPLVATRTDRNIIVELDWEPGLEYYKSLITAEAGREIPAEEFLLTAKHYPFGMYKEGQEDVVRDPLNVTDDGRLACLSDVPQNSVVYLLKGEAEGLLGGARQVIADLTAAPRRNNVRNCLIFDCYSRAKFLGDQFDEELKVLNEGIQKLMPEIEPLGVLALGEIASDGERAPNFHNKTCVVSALYA